MTTEPTSPEHPATAMLRALYADLSTIAEYCDDEVVLHSAERGTEGMRDDYAGVEAVRDKELALIRLTENTLVIDVDHIIANDFFGSVTGLLRARLHGRDIAMPFCGLWRFRAGRIVEHWENAYDAPAFGAFVSGRLDLVPDWLFGPCE